MKQKESNATDFEFESDNSVITKYNGTDSEVKIPEGVWTIGRGAFAGNRFIKSVVFPKSLRDISGFAFANCNNLENVNFDGLSKLSSISGAAFYNTGIKSLRVPSIGLVGQKAFAKCQKLQVVDYQAGFYNAMESVFEGCENLSTFIASVVEPYFETNNERFWIKFCQLMGKSCNNHKNLKFIIAPNFITDIHPNVKKWGAPNLQLAHSIYETDLLDVDDENETSEPPTKWLGTAMWNVNNMPFVYGVFSTDGKQIIAVYDRFDAESNNFKLADMIGQFHLRDIEKGSSVFFQINPDFTLTFYFDFCNVADKLQENKSNQKAFEEAIDRQIAYGGQV